MGFSSSIRQYLSKRFLVSLVIALATILLVVTLGTWLGTHVPEAEAQEYRAILESQAEEVTWDRIFLNNLSVSLPTLIPFLGVGWILFIMFNTGFFLGAVSVVIFPGASTLTRLILVLFVIFLFPGFIVAFFEFGAYTLLLGEVFYVSYLALTRSGARKRLKEHSWKTLLIYVALLLIGAYIEEALIRWQQ